MQQKHYPPQHPLRINRFFDLFCVEVITKFMQQRKVQLDFTAWNTDSKLIIIYQNNELNIVYHHNYITVCWWSGYHRFNGQPHHNYQLTQYRRSYYKQHENTGKVFTVSLAEHN